MDPTESMTLRARLQVRSWRSTANSTVPNKARLPGDTLHLVPTAPNLR